ncbi:hypothetical protein ACFO8O_08400 [Hephaestia sp. GCM10023244]|uniref:hypothetical protein n=1 Tax=unclassified Hephaestia TaxID=2631281 RepID=UPI0020777DAF|nr:hypothetical protein [Hephaestia sp. MAHUQ-44]MCM8730978.1 hypothetical protein [Hephaestia sp. MAHUQ-44]
MNVTFAMLAAPVALIAVALPAQDQAGDIADKIINNPNPQAFQVYNAPEPARVVADKKVQGGHALRVQIPGGSAQPWSISLSDPIDRPVAKGDRLVLAFYARAARSEAAGGGAHLPNNGVQLARAPYTGIFGGAVDITPDWTMYHLQGVADRDYAAGELAVSMHLASGKQTLEFGPIFVLDLGPPS